MKKIIFTALTVIFALGICFSQDVITKKSGEDVQAKVLEVGLSEIKYKKFDNQNGPIFTMLKSEILMVRYENGTKNIFTESNKSTEKTASVDGTRTKEPQAAITQDVITKKSGEDVQAKVLEVGLSEIKYKKFDNQNGPTFTMLKSEILMVRYENGTKDIFTESNKSTEKTASIDDTRTKVPQAAITNRKYKNRISLNIGGGSGFESVPMVDRPDGTKSSISFGGGTIGKFEYGYEFNNHFDLAIGIGAQFSELDKSIGGNGSVEFNRGIISLTPSYILPIDSRGNTRLKFGVGIDWLYNAELNFDLSKISGGGKDIWKYNSTIGEHVSIIFEINSLKRFSYNAGLRLYNVNYTFESGGNSYPGNGSDLKSPDGSGIDFLLGVNYHF